MGWITFDIVAAVCIGLILFLGILILFEPGLKYRIRRGPVANDSREFLHLLGALCDAQVRPCEPVRRLKNGDCFYPAELAAIAAASRSIHLEAYIFKRSRVAQDILDALCERARNGVRVKLVVDAIGSLFTPDDYFKGLREAGGNVCWYQPLRWYTFKRWNNRTHRKLMVIDGKVGFCGGADIGDEWLHGAEGEAPWRDTVFRFDGHLVCGLQSTFAENWLESSGEILADAGDFPLSQADSPDESQPWGMVVNSTPSAARGTRAHILFQTLIAFAEKSIQITTPYFLPDRSTLREITRAAKERGVKITILTPGKHADHLFTRSSSRRLYGHLLKAGVEIHEYQPAMIHAKTMVIDGLWCVVGSTNFDNRSLGLNDEVNVAVRDTDLAATLAEDFEADLRQSNQITYEHWAGRPVRERVLEAMFRIFDRQF